jgi:glycosyltransferase involved in cell wall biosynthesis
MDMGIMAGYVPMQRAGFNPLREAVCIIELFKTLRGVRPDIVHLVTIKPYLYGGIAARFARIPGVVSAVAGLGSVFIRRDLLGLLFRSMLYPMYRMAFGHPNQVVIVQNYDDAEVLIKWGVAKSSKIRLVRGSGVDLSKFLHVAEPNGVISICFASRLLRDKGIFEFAAAGRLLRKRGLKVRLLVAGSIDEGNPSSLDSSDLASLQTDYGIEFLGFQRDVGALFQDCNIVCLPSYREGFPKVLLEAAASGRAVVTTDVPGCRDAIIPNMTGLLVSAGSYKELADALQRLIEAPHERLAMGVAGRRLAEREFSVETIVRRHLDIYRELMDSNQ